MVFWILLNLPKFRTPRFTDGPSQQLAEPFAWNNLGTSTQALWTRTTLMDESVIIGCCITGPWWEAISWSSPKWWSQDRLHRRQPRFATSYRLGNCWAAAGLQPWQWSCGAGPPTPCIGAAPRCKRPARSSTSSWIPTRPKSRPPSPHSRGVLLRGRGVLLLGEGPSQQQAVPYLGQALGGITLDARLLRLQSSALRLWLLKSDEVIAKI